MLSWTALSSWPSVHSSCNGSWQPLQATPQLGQKQPQGRRQSPYQPPHGK